MKQLPAKKALVTSSHSAHPDPSNALQERIIMADKRLMKSDSMTIVEDHIVVLLLILTSGSCIGLLHASIVSPLLLAMTTFVFLRRESSKINCKNILLLVFILFLLLSSCVLNTRPNIGMYFNISILLVSACLCCYSMSFKSFSNAYINILAGITLLAMAVFLIGPQILGKLVVQEDVWRLCGPVNVSSWYSTMSINTGRFASIFWEPGANQFFLSLGLLLSAEKNKFKLNKNSLAFYLTFASALLLTRSTSGYITLAIIALYLLLKSTSRMRGSVRWLAAISFVVLCCIALSALMNTETIVGKFDSSNASYTIRTDDAATSVDILLTRFPIIGFGYGTLESIDATSVLLTSANSVGLLSNMISVGILETCLLVTLMLISIRKNLPSSTLIAVLVFAISMATENFFFYPIYFVWLFDFQHCEPKEARAKLPHIEAREIVSGSHFLEGKR